MTAEEQIKADINDRLLTDGGLVARVEDWQSVWPALWLDFCGLLPNTVKINELVNDKSYSVAYNRCLTYVYNGHKEALFNAVKEAHKRADEERKRKPQTDSETSSGSPRMKEAKKDEEKAKDKEEKGKVTNAIDESNKAEEQPSTENKNTSENEDKQILEEANEEQELTFEIIDEGKASFADMMKSVIGGLLTAVSKAFSVMRKVVASGFRLLDKGLSKLGSLIKTGFSKAKKNLVLVLLALFLFFRTNFLSKVAEGFRQAFPHLSEKIDGLIAKVEEYYDEVKQWIDTINWDEFKDQIDDFYNWALDKWDYLAEWFGKDTDKEIAEKDYAQSYSEAKDSGAFDVLGLNERQIAQMSLEQIQQRPEYQKLTQEQQKALEKLKSRDYSVYLTRAEKKAVRKINPNADLNRFAEAKLAREQGINEHVLKVDDLELDMNDDQQMIVARDAINKAVQNMSLEEVINVQTADENDNGIGWVHDERLINKAGIEVAGIYGADWSGDKNLAVTSAEYFRKALQDRRAALEAQQPKPFSPMPPSGSPRIPQPNSGLPTTVANASYVVNNIIEITQGEPGRSERP